MSAGKPAFSPGTDRCGWSAEFPVLVSVVFSCKSHTQWELLLSSSPEGAASASVHPGSAPSKFSKVVVLQSLPEFASMPILGQMHLEWMAFFYFLFLYRIAYFILYILS